jgi:hypothetical protein
MLSNRFMASIGSQGAAMAALLAALVRHVLIYLLPSQPGVPVS